LVTSLRLRGGSYPRASAGVLDTVEKLGIGRADAKSESVNLRKSRIGLGRRIPV
jgi:hypothetical protein